jgi:hypothetical protein
VVASTAAGDVVGAAVVRGRLAAHLVVAVVDPLGRVTADSVCSAAIGSTVPPECGGGELGGRDPEEDARLLRQHEEQVTAQAALLHPADRDLVGRAALAGSPVVGPLAGQHDLLVVDPVAVLSR